MPAAAAARRPRGRRAAEPARRRTSSRSASAAPTALLALITSALGARCQRPAAARRLAVRGRGRRRPRGRDRPGRSCQPGRVTRLSRDCSDDACSAGGGRARTTTPRCSCSGLRCWPCRSAANLGAAWLLIEATTAASALLVAFSRQAARTRGSLEVPRPHVARPGRRTARGPGARSSRSVRPAGSIGLSWTSIHAAAPGLDHELALLAYLLLLAGLAAKIGWAPVHNWLPDAHSEAPAPVSALLSAALLPAVLLVAWRVQQALAPAVGAATAQHVFIFFGLASLAVAVPFLWRPLAWKRLLAYSSLEHMGVIALGIGFGTPLALAGAIVHVAGHAIAKALGFYAAMPLLGVQPSTASHAGARHRRAPTRALGAIVGLCLGRARRPAALAAVRLRADDRARRRPGRLHGRGGRRAASCSRSASSASAHALIEAVAGAGAAAAAAIRRPPAGRAGVSAGSLRAAPALARGRALRCPGSAIARRARAGALVSDRDAASPRTGSAIAGAAQTARASPACMPRRRRRSRSCARCSALPDGRAAYARPSPCSDGRVPASSTSRRPRSGPSARRTISTASASTATSRCVRSSTTTATLASWTVPVAGRRVPGRRRPDPRRRDRVGALPLPRRRRSHPAPRRPPLLQAPRSRARRRGRAARRRPSPTPRAPAPPAP